MFPENKKPIRERKSAKEQAQETIDIAQAQFQDRDDLVATCKEEGERVYGLPAEGAKCGRCGQPAPSCDSHVLPRSGDTTDDKARMLWELMMQDILKHAAGLGGDADKVEEAMKYAGFKQKQDDYVRYVIGVVMAIGPDGVVFYGSASGFDGEERAPVAYALKCMLNDNGADKKEYIGDASLQRTGLSSDVHYGLDTKSGKPVAIELAAAEDSNAPGGCAAAKLLKRCFSEGTVPLCMTEIFVEPAHVRSVVKGEKAPRNIRMVPAESCATCKDNLPRILCGLQAARENFGKAVTEKLREDEQLREHLERERQAREKKDKEENEKAARLLERWFMLENKATLNFCPAHAKYGHDSEWPDELDVDNCYDPNSELECDFDSKHKKGFGEFVQEKRDAALKMEGEALRLRELFKETGRGKKRDAFLKQNAREIELHCALGLATKDDFA